MRSRTAASMPRRTFRPTMKQLAAMNSVCQPPSRSGLSLSPAFSAWALSLVSPVKAPRAARNR